MMDFKIFQVFSSPKTVESKAVAVAIAKLQYSKVVLTDYEKHSLFLQGAGWSFWTSNHVGHEPLHEKEALVYMNFMCVAAQR